MLKHSRKLVLAFSLAFFLYSLSAAQSMIAHWTFDEGKGDSAYDISGKGNHMRLYNGAKWIRTRCNYGVDLDGLDDVCKAADKPCQNGLTQLTAEGVFLIKQYNIYDQFTVIVDKWGPGSWEDDAWACDLYNEGVNGLYGNVVGQNDIQRLYSYNKLPLNKWFHLALVWTGDSLIFYVNGAKDTACRETVVDIIQNSSSELRIGNGADGNNGLFGIIDDVRLYNYALSPDSINAHFKLLVKPVYEINLGMKTYYAKANDEVWVPLYISNFEDSISISSIQFAINIDSSVVQFVEVSKDSGIAKNWTLAHNPMGDSIKFSMGGAGQTIKYGEGELIRCKFKVKATAATGELSDLVLSEVRIDEDTTIQITTTIGKIIINNIAVMYGDVSGNNEVTAYDGAGIVQYVMGTLTLPNAQYPNFTLQVADVSGDKLITSYDAALVFQYSVGLLHKFPVETGIGKGRFVRPYKYESYPNSTFKLVKSAFSTDKTVYYDLTAQNIKGAISSDIEIRYDPAKILMEQGGNISSIEKINIETKLDKIAKIIKISITTNDDIDVDGEIRLATIESPVNDTSSLKNALLFVKASVDEESVKYLIPSVTTDNIHTSKTVCNNRNAIVCNAGGVVFYNVEKESGSLEMFDMRGRRMFHAVFTSSDDIIRINAAQFAPGLYLYRKTSGTKAVMRTFLINK